MSRTHRLTTTAGTVLAVAALAAGPAWGQSQDLRSPDTRDAAQGRWPVSHQDLRSPDAVDAARASSPAGTTVQDLRSPDTQDAANGRWPVASTDTPQDLRSPDARDAAERRTPVIVRVERPVDTGLSWDSAAVGALASAGLLFALAGIALLVSRRRLRAAV
jgi:hypothetical protein